MQNAIVVCDPDLFMTDVFCGYPGSVHDARVFRNSISSSAQFVRDWYERECSAMY